MGAAPSSQLRPGRLAALSRASERQQQHGLAAIAWPVVGALVPEAAWWTTPELCSLWGTPAWDGLDERARRRLCFWEAVAFFSLNVHNERRLVDGAQLRRDRTDDSELADYLDHFVREEQEHTAVFARFCQDHGGGVFPDRNLALPGAEPEAEPAPGRDDFVFFARVLLFEEVVDAVNLRTARDPRVAQPVRAIHEYHHRDEARHLAFGREMLRRLWLEHGAAWSARERAATAAQLDGYLASVGRDLCSVDALRAAGLPEPHMLRRVALSSAAHARRLQAASLRPRRLLVRLGLPLDGEVA